MTTEKLLHKLHKLTENVDQADQQHIKKLRKVLRKLKAKKHKLTARLEECETEQDQQKIQQEIDVLTLQRKKGATIYKRLKASCKSEEQDSQ